MDAPLIYHGFGNIPYFFSQGGCLENKINKIRSQSKWDTMNKYVGNYNGCTSYVSRIWLKVTKTILIFCSTWLPRK